MQHIGQQQVLAGPGPAAERDRDVLADDVEAAGLLKQLAQSAQDLPLKA
jgi:hypothetical protein